MSQIIPTNDIAHINRLIKDFNFLISNIADFGLLGLGTDYISQLHALKNQLSDLGIESIGHPIEQFIQGYNVKDYGLMAKNLFYLSNWTTLYLRKLQILNLKLDLKDESILDKSKESIELVEEKDITFIPLTIIIEKVIENKTFFTLNLRWLGISFLLSNPGNVSLTTFVDEAFTKSQYSKLFFVQERIKSKFFINQVILFSQLMNTLIQFKKVGIFLQENIPFPSFELQYTVNTFPTFSGMVTKEKLLGLVPKSSLQFITINRNCIIEIHEQQQTLIITLESKSYHVSCDNFYLMIQLYTLYFTGISIDLLLVDCMTYHQFRDKDYLTCSDSNDSKTSYHAVTITQGGENIIIGLQQFNIRINYNYVFDKLILKYSKTMDTIENIVEFISLLINSQISVTHPKIKVFLSNITVFIHDQLHDSNKFSNLVNNLSEILNLAMIIDFLEPLTKDELSKKVINFIINLEKKDLTIEKFKRFILVLGFLTEKFEANVYLDEEEEPKIKKFINLYRMKVSSRESLIVQKMKSVNFDNFQKQLEKFSKIIQKSLESVGQISEDLQESIILLKGIFKKSINIPVYDKKMMELSLLWDVVQNKTTTTKIILFYYLNKY